ncbi:MAG: RNA methyltransferase, partial [candidate division WOR-3 bacterium]
MVIYGKHPVICAIDSNASIEKVLIYENLKEKEKILNMCKAKNINYELVSKFKIEQIVSDDNHQGVCAYLINEPVCKLSENLENFLNSENKILLIIDRIQDPYNLGSIIRSAFVLNVKNIVSTYTQSSKITPSVIKASAGAIFYINFSYSDNLKRVIEILKENKIPVYSLE